ncbi:MAG: glycoside hydrolase family 5 protein [Ruminococcus sp.]|nr:glycoside hydrolase family 5 protein [Ruminococcus sp.]
MRTFEGFIKGVNIGGWLSQCWLKKEHMDTFITEQDFADIKNLGLDHIRLPIDYMLIENEEGEPLEEGYEYIDKAVLWAKKYGLNVLIDLHRTAGYSFGNFKDCSGFFTDEVLQERFFSLWDKLSARYGKYDHVAFDLLNEVVDENVSDKWNEIALRAIERVRKNAPDNWILVGGARYNHIYSVKELLLPPDDKIVYSFHYYEPHIFSHQGASWEKTMPLEFRVSYPLSAEEYMDISDTQLNGAYSWFFKQIHKDAKGIDMLEHMFLEAVEVAKERNVPLYCGEYGVIVNADPQDTLRWYKDMNAIFTKYGIGRAAWSYKKMGFGIIDDHMKDVIDDLKNYL